MDLITYLQEMWQLAIQGKTQGIWFWAAFYTLILCSGSLIYQIRMRRWPDTKGQLVESGIRKFGGTERVTSNQDYVSKALYHYDVSGITYDGSRISPWVFVASHNARFVLEKQMSSIQRYSDGSVKVFYNLSNPKKSFLIIAGKAGLLVTLTIIVLPMILYILKYHG